MKKLILTLLTVFCFLTAGSAFAGEPNCGVWILSPGTTTTTLDATFGNIPGLPGVQETPCAFLSWRILNYPSSCVSRTTLFPYWLDNIAKPGTTTCKAPALCAASRIVVQDPGNLGTISFADIRVPSKPKVWYGKILKNSVLATQYYPGVYYTSTQTSACSPDLAATFNPQAFFTPGAEHTYHTVLEAEIISGHQGATIITPSEYSTVEAVYEARHKAGAGVSGLPGGNIKLQDDIFLMTVLIKKPLRGDLDLSGVMTGNDGFIFGVDWAQSTPICGCGNYF